MTEITFEAGIAESISRDLQKCKRFPSFKPIWVLAEENNAKPFVLTRRKVKETRLLLGVQQNETTI